ncbi:hypothetical protein H632_c79p1 [Helicosporidium sp. ATCC 50920]|nr:hypothetical protein H632_c79p1 [Helicosporidium sp. ATCC 50920]|eukprot:KDD76878.1 hypothetical protein H632_c79p1 [Helicosporidium sp. ATCC 50920]
MGERQHLLNDMYTLYGSLTGQKWKNLRLSASGKSGDRPLPLPEPRWKAAVAQLDSKSPALLVHGGSRSQNESGEEYLSDVWKLELSAAVTGRGGWEPAQASKNPGDGEPSARRAHTLVAFQTTQQTNHTLVLFGGRSPDRAVLSDVWTAQMDTWPVLRWTPAGPAAENDFFRRQRPSARKGHVAVAGELRGRTVMLVHGGRDDDTYMGDVWAFDVERQAWEPLKTSGDQPPPRDHHGGVFYNGFFYIFGGRTGEYHSQFVCLDDLWRLDLKVLRWDRVVGGGGNGKLPLARFLYSSSTIVDAEGRAKFVVFGGETQFRCKLNDVWDLDLATGLWTQWHQATMSGMKCRQLLA